jgi:hypothetical protein
MPRVIDGFRTAQFTPERVLRNSGLAGRATVGDLVQAARAHDATNPGYLSEKELRAGAEDLVARGTASSDDRVEGYRFAGSTLGRVQGEVLKPNVATGNRYDADAIVDAAKAFDDGNRYLNKKELMAGALSLQITDSQGSLSAGDIATIRQWTGAQGPGPAVAPTALPDEVDGLTADEARTLLKDHYPALDLADLIDAADDVIDNRDGDRTDDFHFSVSKDGDDVDVTLSTSFDYDGAEFSHYTSFSVSGDGDWQLTDAGAD